MKKKLLATILAVLSATALVGCGANSAEPAAVPAGVAVQVKTVERRDVATENRVSGAVTSDNETSIFVSSTAKCTAVYFEAGDVVEEGDIICTLDLGSTLASYNAAKISYDSAVTGYRQQKAYFDKQVELLQKQIENTRALFEIGAASQLEIDNLEVQLLQLEATRDSTLSQLRAGMESYRSNLEQLNLVMDDVDAEGNVIAPASGTLASLNAAEGSFVSASYPVAVISDAEQMKVTVYVSEALVPKLTIGDAAHVSVTSAGAEFTAVVRSVEQTANLQTKLYAVVLSVPSDVTGLISGMFADVTFFTETAAGAVAIPSEAILTANGEQYVYLVENDTAKRTAVQTGLTGDGVTEVLSGIKAGEKLVVVGQQYLSDGDAVRVVSGG
ncbi:MAG: efflux RND transporter periplasmic adaptor subunit [Oscillospiraceae bacterium]|nr:efflux RND transporter periplasmic adaptor subunit [Oscillospiraceae bacterium]